ncbi:hypothetical protein EVAR_55233_1 [Eumeta japonica]|uniref:Uncharacterized protein n=1 Tax=Eumeta variegata TaxID=151549 RepID=A0A4C1ZS21_EUMVA|nr:hypothetical protein EVAR_55233_1 [Eumeta japonica]
MRGDSRVSAARSAVAAPAERGRRAAAPFYGTFNHYRARDRHRKVPDVDAAAAPCRSYDGCSIIFLIVEKISRCLSRISKHPRDASAPF